MREDRATKGPRMKGNMLEGLKSDDRVPMGVSLPKEGMGFTRTGGTEAVERGATEAGPGPRVA